MVMAILHPIPDLPCLRIAEAEDVPSQFRVAVLIELFGGEPREIREVLFVLIQLDLWLK